MGRLSNCIVQLLFRGKKWWNSKWSKPINLPEGLAESDWKRTRPSSWSFCLPLLPAEWQPQKQRRQLRQQHTSQTTPWYLPSFLWFPSVGVGIFRRYRLDVWYRAAGERHYSPLSVWGGWCQTKNWPIIHWRCWATARNALLLKHQISNFSPALSFPDR